MRRLLVATLMVLLAAPAAARAADEIVVLEDGRAPVSVETAALEREHGFEAEQRFSHAVRGFSADLTAAQVRELRADPAVASVVPNRPVRAAALDAAADWATVPPGVRRITAAPSGQVLRAATGAVAVVDTGVDLDHPDLNVESGYDCIDHDSVPDDGDGHGTHVAGTIGARNDGAGVTGVAPGTRIVAYRVLDDHGEGTLASVVCGLEKVLEQAAGKGITVVNLSLGGGAPAMSTCDTDPEHAALCALADAGITPVVAAGNERARIDAVPQGRIGGCGEPTTCFAAPAVYPEVLTVAAMTDTDGLSGGHGGESCRGTADDTVAADFSNYAVDAEDAAHLVAAPGTCIASTYADGAYTSLTGTSMAAPHVAALVALCDGEAGAAGPCASLSTPQVIQRMRALGDAAAFTGVVGRDYGPLALHDELDWRPADVGVRAGGSEASTAPPISAPAVAPVAPVAPAAPVVVPPAPVPPPTPVPVARLAVTAVAPTLAGLRSRGLAARLTCPAACAGVVRLRVSRTTARALGLSSTTLASVRATKTGAVRLRLTARARKALRRARRLSVVVVADVRSGGRTVRTTKTLTLRR